MPKLPKSRPIAFAIALAALLSEPSVALDAPMPPAEAPEPTVLGWQVADGLFNQFAAPTSEAPGQPETVQDAAEPIALAGLWSGTYVCNQGNTELDLILTDLSKGLVWGIFSFHAPPENPTVPSGQFFMAGRYDPHSGEIELVPGEWIVQPPGYSTVGLTGQVTVPAGPEATEISGAVIFDGCTAFEVRHAPGTEVNLGTVPPSVQTLVNSLK